jgi:hypothetical protein
LGWLANMIKSITGKSNWRTPPATTLETAKAHMDATTGVHGATSAATPNTIVQRDADGRFKASAPVAVDDVARKDTVDNAIAALRGAAPGTLDTLAKLAQAIANDPNFAATINAALAGKLSTSGGTMTGPLTMVPQESNPNSYSQPIYFKYVDASGVERTGYFQFHPSGNIIFSDGMQAYDIWTSRNDGAGSGLSADDVDGYHANQLVKKNTENEITLRWSGADTSLHVDVDSTQDLPVAKAVDAYTVRGYLPDINANPNTIVQRDANGDSKLATAFVANPGTPNNSKLLLMGTWSGNKALIEINHNNDPAALVNFRVQKYGGVELLDVGDFGFTYKGRDVWHAENNGPGKIIDLITEPVRITSPLLTHEAQTLNGVALNLHDFRTYLDRSFFTGREVYLEVVAKTSSASVNAQVNLWADGMWEGGGPSQINFTSVNSGRFRTGNIASSIASIFAGKEASIAGGVNNGGTLTVYRARLIIL